MKTVSWAALALCAFGRLAPVVSASEVEVNGDAGFAWASSYTWRGKELSDSSVIQPEINVKADRWTLNVWGTWDLQDDLGSPERTRVDVALDYGIEWKSVDFNFGLVTHIYHDDPGRKAKDTYETYLQATAGEIPLYPSVKVFYDFGSIDSFYVEFSVSESRELAAWAELMLRLKLGVATGKFNEGFFGSWPGEEGVADDEGEADEFGGGAVDLTATVALPVTYETMTIIPKLEYVSLVNSDLERAAEAVDRNPDRIIGSISIAWSF